LFGCVVLTAASVSAQTRRAAPVAGSERPSSEVLVRAVDVDCSQGQTISAAVARLAAPARFPPAPQLIRVSGACQESVVIEGFDRLTIQGQGGATLTTPATASDSAAIKVVSSRSVAIEDLSIDAAGAFAGVLIRRCQDCAVRRTAISNGSVSIYIEQPGFTAVSNLASSAASVGGVWVRDNASAELSGAVIQGTGGGWLGVWAYDSANLTLVATTVRGFFGGIGANSNASILGAGLLDVAGDRTIRIENNGYAGVWVTGRSRVSLGSSDVAVVISNNTTMGVVAMDASVSLDGDVQISGHAVSGLYADQHATFVVRNTQISASGTSLWASLMSLVNVTGPVTVSGSTTDIRCDAFSLVSGAASISGTDPSRISCTNLQ
jgi:hypothetical protein